MSLKIWFGQKQKLLGKLLWLVLWQSEWIIVMTQSGFSHWKYLKLCFAQGRISWRYMSRLQRITGKPGSDFSDSKKALQSHQVQIKLKKTSDWATARRNLKRVAYYKNICICFLLEEAPAKITDINKRKVPWIPKLTWSSRRHSWPVITAETFYHKPESLCSFSELRAKKQGFFLCVCTSKMSQKFKNWIFIQYIQVSTQTQMIFSSAEWEDTI